MKTKTNWENRRNSEVIGNRYFDIDLGFFTVKKVWYCKEYCKNAETPNGSHWFDITKYKIKTDSGLVYIIPWIKICNALDESTYNNRTK